MAADMELKKAFTEMQLNKIETSKKLRFIDFQEEQLKKSKARYELTDSEISQLPEDTKVYATVGRMFVLSKLPELRAELKTKTEKVVEMIGQCDKNKEFLMNSLKEQEESLRDLVQQKKNNIEK
ncbi:prefoldin subunit 1 [Culicoides brevitarsis]|uniref:prefoldin subunit 1 n=1 Tax=Culicoides brevitarsis TaxID=469753 RepID=UPI00307C7865